MKISINGGPAGKWSNRESAAGILRTLAMGGEVRMTAPSVAELEPFERELRAFVATLDMPVAVQRQRLTLVLRRRAA